MPRWSTATHSRVATPGHSTPGPRPTPLPREEVLSSAGSRARGSASLAAVESIGWARELSRGLLAGPLPQRWSHTCGVAGKAVSIAPVAGVGADLLVCAAWLHDIGYAAQLAVTGFHPLDGARYLRDVAGAGDRLCRLVANHSCAAIEAHHRGLADQLAAEFPELDDITAQALTYCDMTTSPAGQPVDMESRLQEIVERYGEGHLVSESMKQARPQIEQAVRLVQQLTASQR